MKEETRNDDRLNEVFKRVSMEIRFFADDQSDTGATYSPIGVGEGARVVQGLLQQVHHMFEGQDAERESVTQRLQPPWARHGSVEWKQRQQSVAG